MSELRRPSKRAHALAELLGEVGAIVLGGLIFSFGWEEFGVGLMVIGCLGFVVTVVRSRHALFRPADP